jgi:drug/metabolite transporter (DMT)-like permease
MTLGMNTLRAQSIVFTLMAMGCIAVLDTTNKVTFATVPLLMVLWCRYIFQALATTGFVLSTQGRSRFQTQLPFLQLVRGLLLFACSYLGFKSLEHIAVAEFTAIAMLTPLLVTVLAKFVMKEPVGGLRWLFILGGLMGALVIVRPGGGIPAHATLYPLSMVLTYASFQVLTSHMAKTEHPLTMHLYTGWVGSALASVIVMGWFTTDLTALDWAKLGLVGLSGTLGHYLLILAYARAPASSITPYLYSSIAFASVLGWVVFDHVPDAWASAGIGLITLCGVASAYTAQKSNPQASNLQNPDPLRDEPHHG